MKKLLTAALTLALGVTALTGCGATDVSGAAGDTEAAGGTGVTGGISVVTREEGSGTRGAFIELFGILVEEGETSNDMTTAEAVTADKTDIMMTQVAGNPNAVGYLSLGSMNDTIKALNIDGVIPTVENVKDGSYAIQRPFNIATKGEISPAAQDFVNYILSAEGQTVVANESYIAVNESAAAYATTDPTGKVVLAGSSSVTPVMEKLQEAYLVLNPDVTIEIQTTDSSAGMMSAMDGSCDIGMASRALKDSELAELSETTIAFDGIVVIVNNENAITELTSEQVKQIFTGEVTEWSAVQ